IQLAHPHVFGALEHHVLEEVGETGAPLALVFGPDFVTDADGVDRRVVVFRYDDPEAIIQARIGELDLGHARGGLLSDRRQPGRQCDYGKQLHEILPHYSARSSASYSGWAGGLWN